MKILIFGATGGTGRELIRQALEQGHQVTAFVRNPAALDLQHKNFSLAKGNILDYDSLEAAVKGQDAALSALGVRKLKRNTILSDGTGNVIRAMEKWSVRRFICESSLGVGDSQGELGVLFNLVIIPLFLGKILADKERQEKYIRESSLDWVIVRPGALTDGPKTGVYRVILSPAKVGARPKISRADTADFMLKQLTDNTYLRKTPGLAY